MFYLTPLIISSKVTAQQTKHRLSGVDHYVVARRVFPPDKSGVVCGKGRVPNDLIQMPKRVSQTISPIRLVVRE